MRTHEQPRLTRLTRGPVLRAGILMYLGFVSLMAEDFNHATHTRLGLIVKYMGVLLGATVMCVLAYWA